MCTAALFIITKTQKQPKCPSVVEWIKLLWDIYTMKYYFSIRKKKMLPFVKVYMDLENIILSEISQSVKDKYHMISLIVESNEQTKLTRQMGTDSQVESRMTAVG